MKLSIIIPCHIHNLKRINKFCKCIMSLINQTQKVNILISVGFTSQQLKPIFINTMDTNNIGMDSHIHFFYHEQPKSQFEHFSFLLPHTKTEFIMFCDNDDMYCSERVERFNNLICNDKNEYSVYLERQEFINIAYNEYPMHVVKRDVFEEFLIKSDKWHYHKYCDMLFSKYLQKYFYQTKTKYINEKLYLYMKSNDADSVTSQNRFRNKTKGTTVVTTYEDLQKYWNEQFMIMKDNLFTIMLTYPDKTLDLCLLEMMGPNFENNRQLMPSRIYQELKQDFEYKRQHLLLLIS